MQFPFTIKDPRPYNETLQIYLANKLTSKDTITNRNIHSKYIRDYNCYSCLHCLSILVDDARVCDKCQQVYSCMNCPCTCPCQSTL